MIFGRDECAINYKFYTVGLIARGEQCKSKWYLLKAVVLYKVTVEYSSELNSLII